MCETDTWLGYLIISAQIGRKGRGNGEEGEGEEEGGEVEREGGRIEGWKEI